MIVVYFCLLNYRINQQESSNNKWKNIKKGYPVWNQFSSYPTIKIGRFAVSLSYRSRKLGSDLMDIIINMVNSNLITQRFAIFLYTLIYQP